MLEQISWSDYLKFTGSITGVYWLAVISIYYRNEMGRLVTGRRVRGPEATGIRPGMPDTPIHQVHDLMEELKPVFASGDELLGKKDLLARIQMRLHNYPGLRGSEFEEAVIHHIILESNEQSGMAVHAEEIRQIWMEGT